MKKQISPSASAPSASGSANVSAAGCDESVRTQATTEAAVMAPILREPGGFLYELTEARWYGPENRWWAHIQTQHGHMTDEQRERLADLFAAAPEMLEALKTAFWVMEDAFGHANAPYQQTAHEALNAVRAAIAKAEGSR